MVYLTKAKDETIKYLEEKIQGGQIILSKCQKIRYQSDYDKLINEYDIWRQSSGHHLKQLFSDESISKDFLFIGVISYDPDETLIEQVQEFGQNVSSDIDKLNNILNDIKSNLYNQQDNTKSINKTKWELSHKIGFSSLCIAFVVLIFGNNLYDRLTITKNTQPTTINNKTIIQSIDTTPFIKQLPYLENYPIIDKGLYLKYYYNDLVFGGVNVDSIQINARTVTSEPIEIKRENNSLIMDITEEPFIEFEYKRKYYSIELTGRHYDFKMALREITSPTMTLKKYIDL